MAKTRKRGGAFVRKGSYGCAFKNPPLKCKSEPSRRSTRELSKLLDDYKANKEFAESAAFQRIDPAKTYFIWAHHKCELNTANVKAENRMDECTIPIENPDGTVYSVVNLRRPNPTLVFYDLGGQDVSDIVLSSGQYGPFFASLLNLLKGLELLHASHYVHLDIKPLNIVSMELPDGDFSTRFIDFSLSMSTTLIAPRDRLLLSLSQFNYPYYPFEFRFVSPDHPKSATQAEVNKWYTMMAKVKNDLPQSEYYDAFWRPRFDATAFGALASIVNSTRTEKILQEVDVYGLGVSFGEIYSRLTRHSMRGYPDRIEVTIGTKSYDVNSLTGRQFGGLEELAVWHKQLAKQVSFPLYKLIGMMIAPNPTRRITASEAKSFFEQIVLPGIVAQFGSPFTYNALKSVGVALSQTVPPMKYTIPAAAPKPAVVAPMVVAPQPQPQRNLPLRTNAPRLSPNIEALEAKLEQERGVLPQPTRNARPRTPNINALEEALEQSTSVAKQALVSRFGQLKTNLAKVKSTRKRRNV